ncbi:uncharacterized protein LOC135073629 isoform X1 [Ostrinia nubilalis]|uniref:uncharacterized protein LOC135073629 isoform X1 n=2 Tax=Ostrinia nubilalis TaxID=29057 RepID=UPI003082673F
MIRFRIVLLVMCFVHAQSNQAPCTEDSHCSIGFYCDETVLFCRGCLSCEDHQREAPPQRDLCVKSLVQCGDCLMGSQANTQNGNEKVNTDCESSSEKIKQHHPYLPPYAWVAIGFGLLLMVITICVFLRTKMFKVVSYSSQTSVRSMRGNEAAELEAVPPPPYNYQLPSTFQPGSATEMPEIRSLIADSPQPCLKPSPETQTSRTRETAGSQEARVFNSPAYVRIPQNQSRCNTPEPEADYVPAAASNDSHLSTRNVVKLDNNSTAADQSSGNASTHRDKNSRVLQVQDSNNNYPREESSNRVPKTSGISISETRVIGGPSFVINVLENIHNFQQSNYVNCYHPDPS